MCVHQDQHDAVRGARDLHHHTLHNHTITYHCWSSPAVGCGSAVLAMSNTCMDTEGRGEGGRERERERDRERERKKER